jgi:GT2 family glycosyltransferase
MASLKTLRQPVGSSLVVSRAFGFGLARNDGAKLLGNHGLMVQFNDDLVLSPKIWDFVFSVKHGEFAFQVVDEWVCSRVFVVHLEDYWGVGGCDENIKFAFEDGDFYLRAVKAGLKFKRVPDSLAVHIPHEHCWMRMKNIAQVDWEWSRLFVKYKRQAKRNMFGFFIRPFHWHVVFQHFVLKVSFTVYWIIRGVL